MKRLPLVWKLFLVGIVILVVAAMHSLVSAYRKQIATLQRDLTDRLTNAHTQSEIRRELAIYEPAIEKLTQYTVSSPAEMLTLVEAIESQGQLETVSVAIPDIEEIVPTIAQQTSQDPITDARIVIIGHGQPEQLIAFIHRVEHLPYALVLEEWDLQTNVRTELRSESGQALQLAELALTIRVPIHSFTSNETSS